MSAYLGNAGGVPLMHFHRDEKDLNDLLTGPDGGTIFHSDLPYVLIRERFTLDSYTSWAGGRKFALSQVLLNYRSANPDAAYLLLLTDSSGRKWLHDPLLNVCGTWVRYWENSVKKTHTACTALNGADYQVAYTSSDAELQNLSRNQVYSDLGLTFRTWDSADTHVTVFKTPYRNTQSYLHFYRYTGPYTFAYFSSNIYSNGTPIQSSGNDVVEVEFVFTNMLHSALSFERQEGMDQSGIDITPDTFRVGSVVLDDMVPLISHGSVSAGAAVSPLFNGDIVCGKKLGVNMSGSKVDTGNNVSGNSAVLEIPPAPGALQGWDIDFKAKSISRNGEVVFDPTVALNSLFVLGVKEIVFNPSRTLTSSSFDIALSSTQTGAFSSLAAASVFMCSVVSGDDKLHSVSVFGVGDNMLASFVLGWSDPTETTWQWSGDIYVYLRIQVDGSCQVRMKYKPGKNLGITKPNQWINVNSVGMTLPSFTVRLVGLGNLA